MRVSALLTCLVMAPVLLLTASVDASPATKETARSSEVNR